MVLSHPFWARVFKREFSPQLSAIVEALEKRTLPAFDGIEKEAESVSEKTWEEFMSRPATGYEDPADLAEVAQEAGISHYLLLAGIRQGMINLFVAALYHTFEQQVMYFHRKQVLNPREENDPKLFNLHEFQTRLKDLGIDITAFSSWPKIDDLRLVANVVKHGEGDSAQRLRRERPALFENPEIKKLGLSSGRVNPRVFLPLAGEDLYVSLADIKEYRDAVVGFWEELADAMDPA
jgi:hypothetical protein